jgi:hypothetical protein
MEKIFVEGLRSYPPNSKAPSFVIADIIITPEIVKWYNDNKDEKGQVRTQLLKSTGGKYYLAKNDYHPKEITEKEEIPTQEEEISISDIPF